MYRDICPGIEFEESYRDGFRNGRADRVLGMKIDAALVSEYGYYGLGYSDGQELVSKNTSQNYYNQ